MKHKPLVIITHGASNSRLPLFCARLAVRRAGGESLMQTPETGGTGRTPDALILAGGTDLHPRHYDVPPKEDYPYDEPRDEMELRWLDRAVQRRIPVLGICRGSQVMNVHRGGSLHFDVSQAYERARYPSHFLAKVLYRKGIRINEGSKLRAILKRKRTRVNSLHTQAIDRVGEGLTVTALERNGVIQGIEDPELPFYMGVQFHPELLVYRREMQRIFTRLLQCA